MVQPSYLPSAPFRKHSRYGTTIAYRGVTYLPFFNRAPNLEIDLLLRCGGPRPNIASGQYSGDGLTYSNKLNSLPSSGLQLLVGRGYNPRFNVLHLLLLGCQAERDYTVQRALDPELQAH